MGIVFLYQNGLSLTKGVYWLSLFIGIAVFTQLIFIWYFAVKRCKVIPNFKMILNSGYEFKEIIRHTKAPYIR